MINIKRAYDLASADDGKRILVDRIWPRGVSKERLQVGTWLRDVAPSTALRQWFAHDPSRWDEFAHRYRDELADSSRRDLLEELEEHARHGTLTLIYSARDTEHNQAVVLREVLEERERADHSAPSAAPIGFVPGDSHDRG